ncbi:hypothetical protein ACN6K5_001566 [Streptomyces violaceoruber]|uniref:hypothetical protein n=1 Tax=Streptomyces violaceoruber group TaxID=2867121 RepID=UPI0033D16ADF
MTTTEGADRESEFDVDAALRAEKEARERGDGFSQALALAVLSQSLYEANRAVEAKQVLDWAWLLGRTTGSRLSQALVFVRRGAQLIAKGNASRSASSRDSSLAGDEAPIWYSELWPYQVYAHQVATAIFDELGASDEAEHTRALAEELDRLNRSGMVTGTIGFAEIAVGVATLKFLGPFVEAFAAKIGETLGESTVQAIKRVSLIRRRTAEARHLGIDLPNTRTLTTLVLPDDFSDEAKLALVDLDITAEGICGATLHWNSETGAWEATQSDQV